MNWPTVSVICTTVRQTFIDSLHAQFRRQRYPGRLELILTHDGTIGYGRNKAIALSQSEYIVVFDDDDWQCPHRVERQVMHLMLTGKAVVGCMEPTFYRVGDASAWRVLDRMDHSAGALLAFRRDWAIEHPFGEAPSPFPEDSEFVKEAMRHEQFSNISGVVLNVMRDHDANDSKRGDQVDSRELLNAMAHRFGGVTNWRKVPYSEVKEIIEG